MTFVQACKLHQHCGLFLFFLAKLRDIAPSKDFGTMEGSLKDQFMHGYLDGDLAHVMESMVPPGDPAAITSFRRPSGPLRQFAFGYSIIVFSPIIHVHCLSLKSSKAPLWQAGLSSHRSSRTTAKRRSRKPKSWPELFRKRLSNSFKRRLKVTWQFSERSWGAVKTKQSKLPRISSTFVNGRCSLALLQASC